MSIILEAEVREQLGKGASRRLRRLENKIPAILYGGSKGPVTIHLLHNKVVHALENKAMYSTVFGLRINGQKEDVILKAIQRHPYKPIIMHMDFQRVSHEDVLVKGVPIHFINEDSAKGVKAGGTITHTMQQVEARCQAKDLPEAIELDMASIELNQIVHLSDLKLPKGVELTTDVSDKSHDLPVASIHTLRAAQEEEPVQSTAESAAEEKPSTDNN